MRKLTAQELVTIRAYETRASGRRQRAQKPKPIHNGDKRRHLISRVMDMLSDWRFSQFEHEASIIHGIRQGLCLQGHGWSVSQSEAKLIVGEAVKFLAYARPSWEEGQPEYADPVDMCSWCKGPIDEERRSRRQRFCGSDCARMALERRDRKSNEYIGTVLRSAKRLIAKEAAPEKPCRHCEVPFKSDNPNNVYCSPQCAGKDQMIGERNCSACGEVFYPKSRDQECCSKGCASRAQWQRRRTRPTSRLACGYCFAPFTPATSSQKYCCGSCGARARAREHFRQTYVPKVFERTCDWCGKDFTTNDRRVRLCSDEHKAIVRKLVKPRKTPLPLTPPVFDYIMRLAA